jgi:uncharacterized protein (TIGR02145 family)
VGFVEGTEREHYGKMKKQFCDERDGQKYVYVTIGEGETAQTWMAENLNYAASGSKCGNGSNLSDNNTTTCDTYGRLYNWSTAMNNSASSTANPSGVQGVCPSGWHIPSDAEWDVLMTAVGSDATKLKVVSDWNNGSGGGNDDYGFSALPGGYGYYSSFTKVSSERADLGYWWSATEDNASNAYYRYMKSVDGNGVVRWVSGDKSYLYSVRCVKD